MKLLSIPAGMACFGLNIPSPYNRDLLFYQCQRLTPMFFASNSLGLEASANLFFILPFCVSLTFHETIDNRIDNRIDNLSA